MPLRRYEAGHGTHNNVHLPKTINLNLPLRLAPYSQYLVTYRKCSVGRGRRARRLAGLERFV